MFYFYLLRSQKDSSLYFGSSNNLKRRLIEHNVGKVASTRDKRPYDLVYFEGYKSERDARIREHNVKLRSNAYTQLKRRIKYSLEDE